MNRDLTIQNLNRLHCQFQIFFCLLKLETRKLFVLLRRAETTRIILKHKPCIIVHKLSILFKAKAPLAASHKPVTEMNLQWFMWTCLATWSCSLPSSCLDKTLNIGVQDWYLCETIWWIDPLKVKTVYKMTLTWIKIWFCILKSSYFEKWYNIE